MMKYIKIVPTDIELLLIICILVVIAPVAVPGYLMFLLFVGYIALNIYVGQKRYGRFHYLMIFCPFLSRKKIYIFMWNGIWKSNKGRPSDECASKRWRFLREMYTLVETLPEGTICTCYTHEEILKQILKIDKGAMVKEAFMESKKSVKAYLDIEDTGEEVQFYFVKFIIHKKQKNK